MKLAGNGQGCGREIRGGGKLIGVRAKTGPIKLRRARSGRRRNMHGCTGWPIRRGALS
jgi:hypothetical protein